MTNWFSNFYGVVKNPPANLIEKAAFAEFGRVWFFRNKVAQRIENGKRLYEVLSRNKEARELYAALITGIAKEAGLWSGIRSGIKKRRLIRTHVQAAARETSKAERLRNIGKKPVPLSNGVNAPKPSRTKPFIVGAGAGALGLGGIQYMTSKNRSQKPYSYSESEGFPQIQ